MNQCSPRTNNHGCCTKNVWAGSAEQKQATKLPMTNKALATIGVMFVYFPGFLAETNPDIHATPIQKAQKTSKNYPVHTSAGVWMGCLEPKQQPWCCLLYFCWKNLKMPEPMVPRIAKHMMTRKIITLRKPWGQTIWKPGCRVRYVAFFFKFTHQLPTSLHFSNIF